MLVDRVNQEQREVDILVTAEAGGYTVHIGIEVIAWSRPADTPWVEKMLAKHQNLPTDKLILVSESGFYEPARRKAAFFGIELLTMEEASGADWPLIAKLTSTGALEVMTVDFDVEGVVQLDAGLKAQTPIPLAASFPTANGVMTIEQLVRSILDDQRVRDVLWTNASKDQPHDFWFSYTQPHGLWRCEEEGKVGQIVELRVGLKVLSASTPVRYATGKFRSVPFVSGISTSSKPLQFVLARNADGTSSGYMVDEAGVRSLSSSKNAGD